MTLTSILLAALLAHGTANAGNADSTALPQADGAETFVVFSPSDHDEHYANGAVPTVYKDALYCMWQSDPRDEDSPLTHVVYSTSKDWGRTWTRPADLCSLSLTQRQKGMYVASGGWTANGDSLIALLNIQVTPGSHEMPYVLYKSSVDGTHWSGLKPVLTAGGDTLRGSIEQDPHLLPKGRLVCATHLPKPGNGNAKLLTPIYTDDPSGTKGWHYGRFHYTDIGKSSREIEPSWFLRGDTVVMVMRDQRSSFRKLMSWSTDGGKTWSDAVETALPDSRSKQSAGNLPDGTAYIISATANDKSRWPLTILLSHDGRAFTCGFTLRTNATLPERRWEGKAKTLGYSYPKTTLYDGSLWTTYTENKERVVMTQIPVSSLSHNITEQ